MCAHEVLGQMWHKEELFDWQMLVQRSEIGRVLECRSMAKRWSKKGKGERVTVALGLC